MSSLGSFGPEFQKTNLIFEISTIEFVSLQNFAKKQRCLNLGPKMLYLGIFRLEFQKTIVVFEISTLEFVYLQSLVQK